MITDTADKIVEYIKKHKSARAKELVDYLGIGQAAVFKQLKKLLDKELVQKQGNPPFVFYSLKEKEPAAIALSINEDGQKIINENFFILSPDGRLLEGVEGFNFFCAKNQLEPDKTAGEYLKTVAKYDSYKKEGLIDGLKKFRSSFKKLFVDEIYYLSFYSIERFGKTKLGTLLLYAKQSQNKKLIKKISELVKKKVERLIKEKKINAIAFIPPTVNRRVQFMKEFERLLDVKLPRIKIVKAISGVAIPQKTLNKLEDRINNAARTIFVDDKRVFKNILLIDDAVGSGATFNETARKIKEKKLATGKIVCLGITGSFKGFDVISEV